MEELTKKEIKVMIEKVGSIEDFVDYLQRNKDNDSVENLIRKYLGLD